LKNKSVSSDTLLKLYEIYDKNRDAILWFLEDMHARSYKEYLKKYPGTSSGRSYFIAVCGFFELSGVLVTYHMIEPDLYFEIFNPTPFWEKAKPVVQGMRDKRPYMYRNFESLNSKRLHWRKKRTAKRRNH
jgi:hypothetical protein